MLLHFLVCAALAAWFGLLPPDCAVALFDFDAVVAVVVVVAPPKNERLSVFDSCLAADFCCLCCFVFTLI